jgi:hypothetical protein
MVFPSGSRDSPDGTLEGSNGETRLLASLIIRA